MCRATDVNNTEGFYTPASLNRVSSEHYGVNFHKSFSDEYSPVEL